MRVNQTQSLEPRGSGAETVQRRNKNASGAAEDNHADFSPAADEQADLAVEREGLKRNLAGEILAENIFRRHAPAVKPLQLFDLRGSQSRRIAVNFVNSPYTSAYI